MHGMQHLWLWLAIFILNLAEGWDVEHGPTRPFSELIPQQCHIYRGTPMFDNLTSAFTHIFTDPLF